MQNKKILSIACLALSFSFLTSCVSVKKTNFNNTWNVNSMVYEKIDERLEYEVTFEKGENFGYEISYSNGKYVSTLKTSVDENGKNIYVYTTNLSIDVTFVYNSESVTLHDSVATETAFYPAENGLLPISSKKTTTSHSPATNKPNTLEDCYSAFSYEYSIRYSNGQGECTLLYDGQTQKHYFDYSSEGMSYLDATQTLIAMRALPAKTSSTRICSYNPFTKSVQTIACVTQNSVDGEFEYYKNGSETKQTQTITYRPIQYQLDEDRPGFAQTAWFATSTNLEMNVYRNVMLRLETPIYRGIGTLIYQLTSINYA